MTHTNRFSRRHFLGTTAGLLVAGAFVSPRASFAADAKRGGTLNFVLHAEPTSLVPLADSSGSNTLLATKITEGLYTYDMNFAPVPQLAIGHTLDDGGKRIVFKLREGVKWHDGEPFTAEDVVFSLNTLKQTHPRGQATFANVVDVKATGEHEVTVTLSAPAPYLINALAGEESPIIPKHIYGDADPRRHPNNLAPVGTGPFRFVEWERGSHLIFDRNEAYWDEGKPYIDRIIVRPILDAASRSIAFEVGEADVGGDYPVPFSDLERLESLEHIGYESGGYGYGPQVCAMEFNLDKPQLKDLRVRQAIAHAVNKQVVLDNVFYGFGKVGTGPIHHSNVLFYTSDVPVYEFDVEKANRILDEAGYPRDKDGLRFSLTHDALPIGQTHFEIGEYLRQALRQIGIDLRLRTHDLPTYIKRVYTDREFDIASNTMTNSPDPTLGVQRFFWSRNFRPGVPFSNGSHYSNPRVDELLEAAQVENDEQKRAELFHEFQRIVAEEIPTYYLVDVAAFTLYNKRVRDHTVTVDGVHSNFADVWLDS